MHYQGGMIDNYAYNNQTINAISLDYREKETEIDTAQDKMADEPTNDYGEQHNRSDNDVIFF